MRMSQESRKLFRASMRLRIEWVIDKEYFIKGFYEDTCKKMQIGRTRKPSHWKVSGLGGHQTEKVSHLVPNHHKAVPRPNISAGPFALISSACLQPDWLRQQWYICFGSTVWQRYQFCWKSKFSAKSSGNLLRALNQTFYVPKIWL